MVVIDIGDILSSQWTQIIMTLFQESLLQGHTTVEESNAWIQEKYGFYREDNTIRFQSEGQAVFFILKFGLTLCRDHV